MPAELGAKETSQDDRLPETPVSARIVELFPSFVFPITAQTSTITPPLHMLQSSIEQKPGPCYNYDGIEDCRGTVKVLKVSSLTVLLFLLGGCDKPHPAQQGGPEARLPSETRPENKSEVAKLETRVAALESTIAVQGAEIDLLRNQLQLNLSGTATLTSDSHNFDIAHNQYGAFTISLEKIEPYLDGYNVTIKVGNLSDAEFVGATLILEWGMHGYEHSRSFDETTDLLPGRFTLFTVPLTPARPTEVKVITASISFSGIKLGVPLNQ